MWLHIIAFYVQGAFNDPSWEKIEIESKLGQTNYLKNWTINKGKGFRMLDQVIDYVPVIFFAKEEDEQNDSDAPIDDLEYEEGFVVPVCGTEPSDEK